MAKTSANIRGDDPMRKCITSVYLVAVFVLQVLALHDGYFDITETKALVFLVLSGLYVLACFFTGVRGAIAPLRMEDMLILSFAFLAGLAAVASGYFESSLLAGDNRYQGLVAFAVYALVFVLVSRSSVSPWAWTGVFGGFFVAVSLAALNHLGFDPLGVMGELVAFDRGRYVSTMGNINFYGAYVCLLLPVVWMKFLQETNPQRRMGFLVLTVFGFLGAAAAKSEGTILGLGVAMVLMPLLLHKKDEAFVRSPLILPLMVLSLQLFRGLCQLCGGDGFSALTNVLLSLPVTLLLAGMGGGLHFLLRRCSEKQLSMARRAYGVMFLFFIVVLFFFLLLVNTAFTAVDLGELSQYFVFDSDWGTDRGKVWMASVRRWMAMPLWEKMIGGGPGCMARMDSLDPVFPDALLDSAHSELLHYMITNGILGLGLYLALIGRVLFRGIQKGSAHILSLCLGLVAYLAQSIVNIAQPMTTPLFFVLLAVVAGESSAVGARGGKTAFSTGKIRSSH